MAKVLILNRREVEALLTLEAILPVIERAFVAFAEGRTVAYPVVREEVAAHRGIFGIKSGYLTDEGVIGLKAGGFWLGNPARGLTAHQSTTVMFDPETGLPTALMDGNHITTIRTAAVGALAARELSRGDSRTAAVLGCGTQGTGQAGALCHVRPIERLRAFDVIEESRERFAGTYRAKGIEVETFDSPEEAVRGADIIVTATPAKAPVLRAGWVGPGTHVSAFGTDTRGKNEVEAALFPRARVVVDDIAQAVTIGDAQHPVGQGLMAEADIHAELGEILAGKKNGRTSAEEITLFDGTGLAFQDLIAGHLAMELAAENGAGVRVEMS